MRALIAVDCDGTVETYGGPIPEKTLKKLMQRHKLLRIGNTPLELVGIHGPTDGNGVPIPGLAYGKSKLLAQWRNYYVKHGIERFIVVDDNPAQYETGWSGWEFMSPAEFMSEVRHGAV